VEEAIITQTDQGMRIRLTDRNTATTILDRWHYEYHPPFYATVIVEQENGPVDWRACGLLFNMKYLDDYSEIGDRWLLAKASGGTAQTTRWTPLNDDGLVDHNRYGQYRQVLHPDEPVRIEVLVLDDQWEVAIDGRKMKPNFEALDPAFAFPAAQQETQYETGNVQCHFSGWEVWGPVYTVETSGFSVDGVPVDSE